MPASLGFDTYPRLIHLGYAPTISSVKASSTAVRLVSMTLPKRLELIS